jgi:hypothetical protein
MANYYSAKKKALNHLNKIINKINENKQEININNIIIDMLLMFEVSENTILKSIERYANAGIISIQGEMICPLENDEE